MSEGDLARFGPLCGAESGEDVLQKLVGGLDGADTVHVDRLVLNHIGGRHGGGLVVGRGAGEGTFGRSVFRGGGVR